MLWDYTDEQARRGRRRKPREPWLAFLPEAYESYVSWVQCEQGQRMITANVRGRGQPGAVSQGRALLAGLWRCRRCGRKLLVAYTGRTHDRLRYVCHRGQLDPVIAAKEGVEAQL